MSKIVVFGGTFNPIHIGHCEIIEEISKLEDIDKILLIPTKIPPHKDFDCLASDVHRVNMCNLVANRFDNVEVSDIEINREGKSYTIDTVAAIKKVYPKHELAITIGADMLTTFHFWKDYKRLLKEVSIIAFGRATVNNNDFDDAFNRLTELGADITIIEKDITDVSSTVIRKNLSANSSLLYEDVYNYILNNNVYGV